MKKRTFLSLVLVSVLSLAGCTGNSTKPTIESDAEKSSLTTETKSPPSKAVLEEKAKKFKEKDASYLGSDEFKKDLNEMSSELRANAVDKGGYTSKEEQIWKYCMDRWDHYDALEGRYSGDKYTEDVFRDAAAKFNITSSEAERIWSKVDGAKLGI